MQEINNFIKLQLPSQEIFIRYIKTNSLLTVPNSLFLDSMINILLYPELQLSGINSNLICILLIDQTSQVEAFSILSELHNSMTFNNQAVTAISINDIDFIFIIVPITDSNNLGLYKFALPEFIGNMPDPLIKYIFHMKETHYFLQNLLLKCFSELESIKLESEKLYNESENMANYCKYYNQQLSELKSQIIKLYEKFETKENELKYLECKKCKSNLKDIMFLPCGHVVICGDCLKQDYNIILDLPILDSQIICSVCHLTVSRVLKYSMKHDNNEI